MSIQYEVFDFDYSGEFNLNGNLKKVYNREAIENALRMWLCSLRGEIVRFPESGGFLFNLLYRPMDENLIENYKLEILQGFNEDFEPRANIISLNLEPNFSTRVWQIDLTIFIPSMNYELSFSVGLKNQL